LLNLSKDVADNQYTRDYIPCTLQFTSMVSEMFPEGQVPDFNSLSTILNGDGQFLGWTAFCGAAGYESADCERAAVFIASSIANEVSCQCLC